MRGSQFYSSLPEKICIQGTAPDYLLRGVHPATLGLQYISIQWADNNTETEQSAKLSTHLLLCCNLVREQWVGDISHNVLGMVRTHGDKDQTVNPGRTTVEMKNGEFHAIEFSLYDMRQNHVIAPEYIAEIYIVCEYINKT